MTRLIWTEPAVADLDSIHEYISRDAEVYADAVILDILDSVDRLIDFPDSGRFIPELEDDKTREIIVGSYRVMYEIEPAGVVILTVLHGAREFRGDRGEPTPGRDA